MSPAPCVLIHPLSPLALLLFSPGGVQFYVWYFHTLPFLLYVSPLPNSLRLLVLAVIEYAWNVFPATAISSGLLIACHVTLLGALLVSARLPAAPATTPTPTPAPAKKVQ